MANGDVKSRPGWPTHLGIQALEVGNLLERPSCLDVLDHFLDSTQQPGVCDGGQIRGEGLAKAGVHAARSSR